jgi:hypothetical protein
MNNLSEIREDWETSLTPVCVINLDIATIVILQKKDACFLYNINRYFMCGSMWVCSIDKTNIALDKVFEYLEKITKK